MAKCVGSVNQWTPGPIELDDTEFLGQTSRQAEAAIKQRVEEVAIGPLLEIATDFIRIKQAALGEDEFLLDSRQMQDGLVDKLKDLINNISATYTYGIVEKLQQFCQTVGRLSEIDQKLYMEEQRKLLISDESITLHALTSIWTAILEILDEFCRQAKTVFSETQEDEEEENGDMGDFLDDLEFSTARQFMTKIFLMDLIISSWIKFNRILDGVVEASPKGSSKASEQILCDLLSSILDCERQPSLMTISVRRAGVIPVNPCYSNTDKGHLGYFIIWYLYALSSRAKGPASQRQLDASRNLMVKSLVLVEESFISDTNIVRLSSHQEERYKLIFHMISVWCERHPGDKHNAILLNHLLEFADSIDSLPKLRTKYFNNSDFNINDSTLFQLCAKLINDSKSYTADGQAQAIDEANLTSEQKGVISTWNLLIERHVSGKATASKATPVSKSQ